MISLNEKKVFTTTKQIVWSIGAVWFLSIILYSFAKLTNGVDLSAILTSTTTTFGAALTGYFTKSFFENKEKYKNNDEIEMEDVI